MPIEGPLRELDIHDVFQLLDLSRKTGALRVTSGLRDNEGIVHFDSGQVVYASVRSNPHPLGTMLVRSGRLTEEELARARARQLESRDGRRLGEVLIDEGLISARELERQLRLQVEAVVFELLSWREGFFSFVEQDVAGLPADALVRISAESLLMEAARRMDEWSTIADRVPDLSVVPALAAEEEGDASPLSLDADAWTVLAAVDGMRDLRAIAAALARSEFDVAMVAARLVQARVIRVARPEVARGGDSEAGPAQAERSMALLATGDAEGALAEARLGIAADPHCAAVHVAAARALQRLGRAQERLEELRRAAQLDARAPEIQRELGYAAARAGDLAEAAASWKRYLHLVAAGPQRDEVVAALDAATRLRAALEAHAAA